jgi:hypothetical protein
MDSSDDDNDGHDQGGDGCGEEHGRQEKLRHRTVPRRCARGSCGAAVILDTTAKPLGSIESSLF